MSSVTPIKSLFYELNWCPDVNIHLNSPAGNSFLRREINDTDKDFFVKYVRWKVEHHQLTLISISSICHRTSSSGSGICLNSLIPGYAEFISKLLVVSWPITMNQGWLCRFYFWCAHLTKLLSILNLIEWGFIIQTTHSNMVFNLIWWQN